MYNDSMIGTFLYTNEQFVLTDMQVRETVLT